MNYSELGECLHITRQGARNIVIKNKSKLKNYLIIKDKKIVGIKNEGVEIIRNLQQRHPNTDSKKTNEIKLLSLQVENLQTQIKLFEKMVNDKDKTIDLLNDQITKLNAQLNHYQSLTFFERLLGYKK